MTLSVDIAHQRFGKLVALRPAGRSHRGSVVWQCSCDCGATIEVTCARLRRGHNKSCGCLKASQRTRLRHGHSTKNGSSGTYSTWSNMLDRCSNPKNSRFDRYGGRGISVCERWRSFDNFLSDMGARPSGMTIGRIDNDKGYELANCEWQSRVAQARNKGNTTWICAHGRTLSLAEWSELNGVKQSTIRARIERGWSAEDAVGAPLVVGRPAKRSLLGVVARPPGATP